MRQYITLKMLKRLLFDGNTITFGDRSLKGTVIDNRTIKKPDNLALYLNKVNGVYLEWYHKEELIKVIYVGKTLKEYYLALILTEDILLFGQYKPPFSMECLSLSYSSYSELLLYLSNKFNLQLNIVCNGTFTLKLNDISIYESEQRQEILLYLYIGLQSLVKIAEIEPTEWQKSLIEPGTVPLKRKSIVTYCKVPPNIMGNLLKHPKVRNLDVFLANKIILKFKTLTVAIE